MFNWYLKQENLHAHYIVNTAFIVSTIILNSWRPIFVMEFKYAPFFFL